MRGRSGGEHATCCSHRTNFCCGSEDIDTRCQNVLFAIVSVSPRARGMEGLPKVHSDHHLGEGVSATPSVVPSVTDDETLAAESDPALGALAGKLHRFAVRNHRFFAGFAAAKYTKHGPGALFVFGNCGMEHTLAEEGDGTCYEEATSCERHQSNVVAPRHRDGTQSDRAKRSEAK